MALTLVFILVSCWSAQAQVTKINGPFLPLGGVQEFRTGTDRDWQKVTVPGRWQCPDVSPFTELGEYRITFTLPDDLTIPRPALVAYFMGQDEVYLNGIRIGGTAEFTRPGNGQRPFLSHGLLRIYPIPPDLLRSDQQNILSIRLNRTMLLEDGGISEFIFGIGDRREAELARAEATQTVWAVDGSFISIDLMLLFIAIVARAMGVTHFVVRTAVKVTFAMSLAAWAGSHYPILPPGSEQWISALSFVAALAVLAFNVEFVAASLDVDMGAISRLLQVLLLFGIVPSGLLPFAIPDAIRITATFLTIAGIGGTVTWLTVMGLVAIRHGDPLGWFIFAVYFIFVMVPFCWGVMDPDAAIAVGSVTGRAPVIIGVQSVTLILSGIFAHRTFRFERESQLANERALRAQEEERRRVARDMHDSVGQWLGSIKMRLQALPEKDVSQTVTGSDEYQELLGDVDVLIDDTRRIAHDLSAISVARSGLKAAVEAHLDLLADDYGVETKLEIPEELDLPERAADHLYRIIQEASNNALNHGEADRIEISLSWLDGRLLLVIRDNGGGFDTDAETGGFGLSSIRDRAGMLRGIARVVSSASGGTEIRISIPDYMVRVKTSPADGKPGPEPLADGPAI